MNVLVCGTNYGASYLRAFTYADADLKLVGILSRGSSRSQSYAEQFQVRHYIQLEQLPQTGIDCAVVAVPGEPGRILIMELLSRGIHVLAEHPLGADTVAQAQALATEHNCQFMINAHFADLNAGQMFLAALEKAREAGPVLHYTLSANPRTLYSALDLLGRANHGLESARISWYDNDSTAAFRQSTLSLGDTRAALICQNFSSEHDDGSANLINHRLDAIFPHGNLLLAETNGPVLWFPTPVSMPAQQWQSWLPVEMTPLNYSSLIQQRDLANLQVLQQMKRAINGGPLPLYQQPEYLRTLSALWQQIVNSLVTHPG